MANTVDIFGIPYAVRRVPVVDKAEYSFGSIDFGDQVILIDDGLSAERSAITLLHEVIHGILSELKFLAENNNDTLVNGLAVALYHCLLSNPLLFNIPKSSKEAGMAKNSKVTSSGVAGLASKVLRDKRSGEDKKTLAASALAQAGGKPSKKKK